MESTLQPKYSRIQSYGSMSSARSDDDMTVHSQLFPYPKKLIVEREILYEEEHPPFQPLFTTYALGKKKFSCLLIGYVAFYIVYLVTGALVFSALETPMENQIRLDVIRAKQDFLTLHPDVLGKSMLYYFERYTPYISLLSSLNLITNSVRKNAIVFERLVESL